MSQPYYISQCSPSAVHSCSAIVPSITSWISNALNQAPRHVLDQVEFFRIILNHHVADLRPVPSPTQKGHLDDRWYLLVRCPQFSLQLNSVTTVVIACSPRGRSVLRHLMKLCCKFARMRQQLESVTSHTSIAPNMISIISIIGN